MADAPIVRTPDQLTAYRITPADTVRLVPLTGPTDGSPTSVFLEIWDPEGVQPDNSHPDSVEVFVFVQGAGVAHSDEHSVPVRAGDVLTLPATSVHHIRNSSATERLYAVTIMANDLGSQPGAAPVAGFHELVTSGTPVPLDDEDLAVYFGQLARFGTAAA